MVGPRLRRDEDLLLRVFVVNPRSAFSQLSAQLDFEHLAVIVQRTAQSPAVPTNARE